MSVVTDPQAPTPSDMRQAMSHFASGITVITSTWSGEPVGFACQSFASLSLAPPLVLFCAQKSGSSWAQIRESGRFCANVLAESHIDVCGAFGSSRGGRFAVGRWHVSDLQTPALEGALLQADCDIDQIVPAGDHDIAIGRVRRLQVSDAREGPLVFFKGAFGLGDRLESSRTRYHAGDLDGWG